MGSAAGSAGTKPHGFWDPALDEDGWLWQWLVVDLERCVCDVCFCAQLVFRGGRSEEVD